jgi:alpha-tubulin suppressor-like RCC1 family protein
LNFSSYLFIFRPNASQLFQANDAGQLGMDSLTPATLGGLSTDMATLNFISFTASLNALTIADMSLISTHTCVLFTTGSIICWGSNSNGRLGYDDTADARGDAPGEMVNLVPLVFATSISAKVVQISSGDRSTCGIKFFREMIFILNGYTYIFMEKIIQLLCRL